MKIVTKLRLNIPNSGLIPLGARRMVTNKVIDRIDYINILNS